MARFDDLVARADTYQHLAAENYRRIRKLAEGLSSGLCEFMDSGIGPCVHLVPPAGPFSPKPYGDEAFSMSPTGFRQLVPVAFGLALRVSTGADWMRVTLQCHKSGDHFTVNIVDGEGYRFELPLREEDTVPFYEHIYNHIFYWFDEQIKRYNNGENYSTREIGFDVSHSDEKAIV